MGKSLWLTIEFCCLCCIFSAVVGNILVTSRLELELAWSLKCNNSSEYNHFFFTQEDHARILAAAWRQTAWQRQREQWVEIGESLEQGRSQEFGWPEREHGPGERIVFCFRRRSDRRSSFRCCGKVKRDADLTDAPATSSMLQSLAPHERCENIFRNSSFARSFDDVM